MVVVDGDADIALVAMPDFQAAPRSLRVKAISSARGAIQTIMLASALVALPVATLAADLDYEANGFRAGVKGGYDLGRKEDDSDYLRGLGDIDAGGVIGGIVSYEVGPFEAYAELDKTIGREGIVQVRALYLLGRRLRHLGG